MRYRYLACSGAVMMSVLMLGTLLHTLYLLSGAVLALVLCFPLRYIRGKRRRLYRFAFLFAAFAMLVLAFYQQFVRTPAEALAGRTLRITAVVESSSETEFGYSSLLRITEIQTQEGEPVSKPPLLRITAYHSGEELPVWGRVTATITPKASVTAGFSYTAAYHSFLSGTLKDITTLPTESGLRGQLEELRQTIQRTFVTKLSDGAARLMDSMLLGDRGGLSDEMLRVFRKTGLQHLLALSGLHLALLTALVSHLCRMIPIGRRGQIILTVLAGCIFLLMTGAQLSMRRALTMELFGAAAAFCNRKRDGLESLGWTVTLLSATQPYLVWHPSFLCSVAATFGILRFARPLYRFLSRQFNNQQAWFHRLLLAASVSVSAWAATLPVAALAFDEVSLIGPLATLFFSPLFSLVMTFGFLTACFTFLPQDIIGILCGKLCSVCGDTLLGGLTWLSRFPRLTLKIESTGARITLLLCMLWFLLLIRMPRYRPLACIGAALILAVGFGSETIGQRNVAEVTVLSRTGEKCVAVETDDVTLLLLTGDPDSIGWDTAEWLAEQEENADLLCLLTPESADLLISSGRVNTVLLPGKDAAIGDVSVQWLESGYLLTCRQGSVYLGEPTSGLPEDTLEIYLRKIPVTAGQIIVKCDIIKGNCGMVTQNGSPATIFLQENNG